MIRPVCFLVYRQRSAQQPFRVRELSLRVIHVRHVMQHNCNLRILLSQHLQVDVHCATVECFRFAPSPLVLIHTGQIAQAHCQQRMQRPELFLANIDGGAIESFGIAVPAHLVVDHSEAVDC